MTRFDDGGTAQRPLSSTDGFRARIFFIAKEHFFMCDGHYSLKMTEIPISFGREKVRSSGKPAEWSFWHMSAHAECPLRRVPVLGSQR